MRACAVVCTYGRESLCELLAMVDRQTLQLPTLVYVDDQRGLRIRDQPKSVHVVNSSAKLVFGAVRRASIEWARELFELDDDSGIVVLDDDDFYCSRHFELTTKALAAAPGGWTGGLAMGVTFDGSEPEYVRGESGIGQHATWAYLLGRYLRGGGYTELPKNEDLGLSYGLGWKTCTPHWYCTHVRRQSRHSISGEVDFDRVALRANPLVPVVSEARPRWSAECEQLEAWCMSRL